jgi:hypothetical protein
VQTQLNRDHMVILKVEGAAAFCALSLVALEYRSPDFARDRFTPSLRPYGLALVDVKQHVRAV